MKKKKQSDKIQIEGITRQDGEIAIEFVDFLAYHEIIGSYNIYLDAAEWCIKRKYQPNKIDRFYNLVHMYVHKILRHKKYLLENEGEGNF